MRLQVWGQNVEILKHITKIIYSKDILSGKGVQ